jgi:hypothetical protein
MPHDSSNTAEGWNLRKRYCLAVMKEGARCLFCDTIADWRWKLGDSTGRTIQWYDDRLNSRLIGDSVLNWHAQQYLQA